MGDKVTKPSTTTWTETELQNFIAWVEAGQVGMISLNLTALDTTAVPDIAAGSIVEIAGAVYRFPSTETPSGWSGISNDTQAYIKLVPSGTSVSAEFTTTAPTYDDDLGGWYSGNDRYVARVYKDASGDAIEKTIYVQVTNSIRVPRDLDVGNEARIGSNVEIEGSVDIEGTSIDFTGTDQDRQIDFASDAQILWDESGDEFVISKGISSYTYVTGAGNKIEGWTGKTSSGERQFEIYKPVTCYMNLDPGTATGEEFIIQCEQNGTYEDTQYKWVSDSGSITGGGLHGVILAPGQYQLKVVKTEPENAVDFEIYITGAYGAGELSQAYS